MFIVLRNSFQRTPLKISLGITLLNNLEICFLFPDHCLPKNLNLRSRIFVFQTLKKSTSKALTYSLNSPELLASKYSKKKQITQVLEWYWSSSNIILNLWLLNIFKDSSSIALGSKLESSKNSWDSMFIVLRIITLILSYSLQKIIKESMFKVLRNSFQRAPKNIPHP